MGGPRDRPELLLAPAAGASPWQWLYGGAHRLRAAWYRGHANRLPRPVISIGNLHWGGTGKTPLVAAVARHLRQRGLAVCILSRGYGRRGRGTRLVSRGGGPLLEAAEAGDEPVLLAGELPGVAVVVGGDRHAAGRQALTLLQPAPQVFVLDDGFSHLALWRDVDVLALPAADLFGGGRLWPGGRLREPLHAVARAGAVVATGVAPDAAPELGTALARALRRRGFRGAGFSSVTRPGMPVLHGPAGSVPLAAGSRVVLVSAIARPERFAAAVAGLDFAVVGELRFPDHHSYPPASLARIAARVEECGAEAALVTAKDRVKLLGRLAVPLAELPIAAEPEAAFWSWLDDALAPALGGAGAGAAAPSPAPSAAPGGG